MEDMPLLKLEVLCVLKVAGFQMRNLTRMDCWLFMHH